MAFVIKDRVRETTTTAGTGAVTLAGAVSGFLSFSEIGDSNQTFYVIEDTSTGDFEIGIGIYTSSGTTLSRGIILESSNSGSAVSFGSGTKQVYVTAPASIVQDLKDLFDGNYLTTLTLPGNLDLTGGDLSFSGGSKVAGPMRASGQVRVDTDGTFTDVGNDSDEFVAETSGNTGMTLVSGATSRSTLAMGDATTPTEYELRYDNATQTKSELIGSTTVASSTTSMYTFSTPVTFESTIRVSSDITLSNTTLASINFGTSGYFRYTESDNRFVFGPNGSDVFLIDHENLIFGDTTQDPIIPSPNGAYVGFTSSGQQIINTQLGVVPLLINQTFDDTQNRTMIQFQRQETAVGSITSTTTSTSYNTSSDYRLKTDLRPVSNTFKIMRSAPVYNFCWKATGERTIGWMAHEYAQAMPYAVTGTKDAVDEHGNPVYQSIDQSKATPILWDACLKLLERVESLEARIQELENAGV